MEDNKRPTRTRFARPHRAETDHYNSGHAPRARREFNAPNGERPQRYNNGGKPQRRQQPNRPQREKIEPIPKTGRAYVPVGEPAELTGLLEITAKGFGFIRVPENNWAPSNEAVYVPADLIAQYHLRPYVQVTGMAQRYERGHQLTTVTAVNGLPPEEAANAPHFDDLKAVNPSQRLAFETDAKHFTTRTLDMVAPVARGQRGLIVAPPRTGKTTLLMDIARRVMESMSMSTWRPFSTRRLARSTHISAMRQCSFTPLSLLEAKISAPGSSRLNSVTSSGRSSTSSTMRCSSSP